MVVIGLQEIQDKYSYVNDPLNFHYNKYNLHFSFNLTEINVKDGQLLYC